jgi:hypothetical protein
MTRCLRPSCADPQCRYSHGEMILECGHHIDECRCLPDSVVDDMEVGRCACGVAFYSVEYALDHECIESLEERCTVALIEGGTAA